LQYVGLLALTRELGWSPLGVEIVHSVVPSLARVHIDFPAVGFFRGSPVRYLKALKHGTGLSVETDVTNTFKKCGGMEVLSVQMHHHIGFLVEFIVIDILNTHACFSGFFDVESVGNVEEVWVNESQSLRDVLFRLGSGVED